MRSPAFTRSVYPLAARWTGKKSTSIPASVLITPCLPSHRTTLPRISVISDVVMVLTTHVIVGLRRLRCSPRLRRKTRFRVAQQRTVAPPSWFTRCANHARTEPLAMMRKRRRTVLRELSNFADLLPECAPCRVPFSVLHPVTIFPHVNYQARTRPHPTPHRVPHVMNSHALGV
jgi:hypothetical protein